MVSIFWENLKSIVDFVVLHTTKPIHFKEVYISLRGDQSPGGHYIDP